MSLPLVPVVDAGPDVADVVDVVWVHGFGGAPDNVAACAAALAQRRPVRVRAVRLPGHGGGAARSFDDAVAALADTVTDRTVLWGYSLGARLAIATAARRPLRALIVESGRGDVDDDARARADDALADSLVARGVDAFFADWERGPLFAHLSDDARAARAAARAGLVAVDVAAALRALSPGRQPPTALARVACPTLLLAGERDARYVAFAHDLRHQWHRESPTTALHILPGVGHVLHMEAPEAVADRIGAFLARLPASAPRLSQPSP